MKTLCYFKKPSSENYYFLLTLKLCMIRVKRPEMEEESESDVL